MSEEFESDRLPSPGNLAFGPGMARAVAEVSRGAQSRGSASEGWGAAGGRAAGVRRQHGSQVVLSRISNGWLLSDGTGWQMAALDIPGAVTAVCDWSSQMLEAEGATDPGGVLRNRIVGGNFPVQAFAPMPPWSCIGVRRLGNGWIVSTFDDTLEMIAVDVAGAASIVREWMARFAASSPAR